MNLFHAAVAALAGMFALQAQAQEPITLYGTIDGGIRHVTNAGADGGNLLKMNSDGEFYNNRLGFLGREGIGGGVNVHYQLEMGWDNGTGALDNDQGQLFQRYALIGIDGPLGTVDLGRMPSLSCKVISFYEPFQYHYVYTIPLAGASAGDESALIPPFGTMGGTRFNNDIQYIGKANGWLVGAEYAFGETAGSTRNGAAQAVAAAYIGGPLAIGGAYTLQRPDISTDGTPDYRNQQQLTVGGSYQVGAARISVGYMKAQIDAAPATSLDAVKNLWGGVSYQLTPAATITYGYYRTTLGMAGAEAARRNFSILGATYALSPRTTLYADIDRAQLGGLVSVIPGQETDQTGISLGISHAF